MSYLSYQEKLCLIIFFIVVFSGTLYRAVVLKYPQVEDIVNVMDNEAFYPKININTATHHELNLIPGIGDYTATRIIDYRKQKGAIQTIDEIAGLPGIYPDNFKRFRPYLRVE